MIIPFSERHKRLISSEEFKVEFSTVQKRKILFLLESFNEVYHKTTDTNWNYTETTFEKVHQDLRRAYGLDLLPTDNETEKTTENFLKNGDPIFLLDIIELFNRYINEAEERRSFEKELNSILKLEAKPIRFMEGEFFRLDSEFLQSEVIFQTSKLLSTNDFETAHTDFLDARQRLSSGDYAGSIISGNNALESYLKKLLGLTKGNQGNLKKTLLKTDLIPDYFNGFINNFDGLVQSAFTIANNSARHGKMEKPIEKNQIDEPIASFYLNLTGTLILFIMDRQMLLQPVEAKSEVIEESKQEDNSTDVIDELPF